MDSLRIDIFRMKEALGVLSRLEEFLSEANLEAKGKVNSWMEGGFEHTGLMQGVELLIKSLQNKHQSPDKIRENIRHVGSPRDAIVRV